MVKANIRVRRRTIVAAALQRITKTVALVRQSIAVIVEAIAGLIGKTGGTVVFDGKDISKHKAGAIAKAGLSLVPQWRELFPTFSVQRCWQSAY